ncbi:amino acid ABC transporter ATP-binding protein [Verrucomicrobium sp. BvORR034]|jgi:polar amino acid transport system ATP-binding protein|uniref:amino acid ABC transporter ATP-binding protein n=1 Tax=Verrucomicrobium sp. BvORR034 TaxID=1396418 RepID=UPI00067935CC|nr:amino acid ABC transporter ATP-binding protein [Verrucomicrobium sp. BvORR034]
MHIQVSQLVKRYGSHVALDGASFEVPADVDCLVLLGASGSGKSTLLRVLGSLLTPDSGSIHINGTALGWTDEAMLRQRRGNGFVFQSFNLFPHLSAEENVALPLREVHDINARVALHQAHETLEKFGLAEHVKKRPAEMSGGQQQRVALARAIAPKPGLLLLDEPTSALDPVMTQEVLDLILRLAEDGQRTVLSTHEITFARKVADWVVFLDHGVVVESAPASQFFDQPGTDLARHFLESLTRYR